jgi:pilus assembly protein CpaC
MIKVLSLFLLFNLYLFAQDTVQEKNLEVAIGIDKIIKLDYKFNPKIELGDETKLGLKVSPKKREIIFKGVAQGKTSVTIRDDVGVIRDKYIVNITADGSSSKVLELRELIGDVEGIEILIKGGKIVIEGEIIVPSDIGRIARVLGAYPDVIPLIEMSPQTQRIIARKMQEEINRNNMKDVTVRVVNGDYWLEGVVNSESKKNLAESIAKAYVPDKVQSLAQTAGGNRFKGKERGSFLNFINVNEKKDPEPPKKLVKVTSQFVELSKDYQKIFAFQWAPILTDAGSISLGRTDSGGVETEETQGFSATISNLFPKLDSAKSAGYARIIQSAMIVTQDGVPASISKDRPIPYAVGSGDTQVADTTNVKYSMSVNPQVGDKEMVNLQALNIDVAIPGAEAASGAPTNTNNIIKTTLQVKSKESAAIGGIVQSTSNTAYDKSPPAGGVSGPQENGSIFFNLIRSKNYNTTKSQFVIFVTPEILESASASTDEIRKKFKKRQR